jgi:hypothetical protein
MVNPFDEINVSDFKKSSSPSSELKEKVKVLAKESNFYSRESIKKLPKPKVVTKTFSLFEEECAIIHDIMKKSLNNDPTVLSGSDIVRAALHAFSKIPLQEQIEAIGMHRGRGRR